MDLLLYCLARAVVAALQALPLRIVAQLGRAGGALAWCLDARHRRVALENLLLSLAAEKSPAAIRALARENFRRIGESFACAVKTAAMSEDEIKQVVQTAGVEKFHAARPGETPASCVIAIGHFGNFELYARCALFASGYQFVTTYRALRQPALNKLLQSIREKSGCLYFERRTDAGALKTALSRGGTALGLLADQHAGDHGLRLPFFGRDCSTSAAPAVLALRYHCPIFTAICYRISPGRWRVEVGDEIATRTDGRPRSPEAIMSDVNRALEIAVRRDPANWFWVHNRWKPGKWKKTRTGAPGVAADSAASIPNPS